MNFSKILDFSELSFLLCKVKMMMLSCLPVEAVFKMNKQCVHLPKPHTLMLPPFRIILLDGAWASLVAQTVKNLPVMQETWARSLGWEDPLEKGTATHSSILAWRIPWTEELAGCSPWNHTESDTT